MEMIQRLSRQQMRAHLDEVVPKGGLTRLLDQEDDLEVVAPKIEQLASDEDEAGRARKAVRKLLLDQDLDGGEQLALEAIIFPQTRPVIDIENDSYAAPKGLWEHLNDPKVRRYVEAAIPSVGRIELPQHPKLRYGGTGFVVGEGLLMTNRHVAELFCAGQGIRGIRFKPGHAAGIDFRQERVASASIYLDVENVVMVHPYWDMALVRVEGLPENQRPLTLSVEHPDDLRGRDVAVIGYPAFDPRNDAQVQNRIFRGEYDVKRLQPGTLSGRKVVRSFENLVDALKHNASTLGGNSGSAVVDIGTGDVVGLHFAGKYMDSNYAVPTHGLARDSFVVDAGVEFGGKTVSVPMTWSPRWRAVDPIDEVQDGRGHGGAPSVAGPTATSVGPTVVVDGATWTIPLQVTVSVGTPVRVGGVAVASGGSGRAHFVGGAPALGVEKPSTIPDPNYSNRAGYDPAFLPGHEVLIPWLSDAQYDVTARNTQAVRQRHVLPYHHFSVVMNRERRVAFFTAVNIDGASYVQIPRDDFNDFWSLDPRIAADEQIDNEGYRDVGDDDNPLDRGHLVRRLDPCWGATHDEVVAAHHDTFHYSNSAPQHRSFNRSASVWGGMENYILNNANAANQRVSVFSGPVFRDDDPVYMAPTGVQVQLPLEYWKVVVFVRDDGSLAASGYLLSQEANVAPMVETFEFGQYRSYQVSIEHLEEITELDFRGLADHDVAAGGNEAVGRQRRELRRPDDASF